MSFRARRCGCGFLPAPFPLHASAPLITLQPLPPQGQTPIIQIRQVRLPLQYLSTEVDASLQLLGRHVLVSRTLEFRGPGCIDANRVVEYDAGEAVVERYWPVGLRG